MEATLSRNGFTRNFSKGTATGIDEVTDVLKCLGDAYFNAMNILDLRMGNLNDKEGHKN